ncbi:MAG: hypothetical protein JNL58_26450 [Planctomyces sp.]|nr:hypothetical protein [Planctomyces sp.]
MDLHSRLHTCRSSLLALIGRSAVFAVFGILAMTSGPLVAQQSQMPFVEGLRERGYFDTAVEFLEELSAKPDLPAEVREVLDLEFGMTWQQMGSASRIPEDREQQLAKAEQYLRKFSAEHAEHPLAPFANSSLGELLFERARTLMWQTDSPSNSGRKAELQLQARQLVKDAESIYQKAFTQYESQYKAFPSFIDEVREEEEFKKRLEAESRYLRSWFQLTRCTYEMGLTFDPGSEERKQTLIKAAELFEKIHASRRTNPIGLNAHLMMGKCFQEQDDIGRALGIYNEIIGHKTDHPLVTQLKNTALHYRLICFNSSQRNYHQVVFNEASDWLQKNKSLIATQVGQGILWEKTIAEEKLSEDRSLEASQRDLLLRQALEDAQVVTRYAGPYREPANAMIRRIKSTLGDTDKEPRDFDTAFQRARNMIDQITKLRDDVDAAANEQERQQKQMALDLHLKEVGRLLRLALDLAENDTDPKARAQARFLLSFIYYRQRKNFDAVIMATYCMTKDRSADPDSALSATEIAIGAALQAFNDAPAGDRAYETTLLRDVCLQILELYPQSAKGNEARIRLGRVYQQLDDPMEAVKWFLEVPREDPMYAGARLSAGQCFLAAWSKDALKQQSTENPTAGNAADLLARRNEAKTLLTEGITLFKEKLGSDAPPLDEMIAAEVSLASIQNLDGEFQATIDRLTTGGENSIVAAVSVAEGETRPETGIRSRAFAAQTYRILLRAYVGVQQIDEARKVMDQLEAVGSEDITAVYTQLGMELQEELQRLKQSGEAQRLKDVRESFEKFLQKVYDTRDKTNFSSLLWIGETYFGLGQGISEDVAGAAAYYDKAATTYREILDSGLVEEPTATAVRLRLARCRRQQQKFEEAYQIAESILKTNPLALHAQFEAAHILSDWGAGGNVDKFLPAIQGVKNDKNELVVWGWSNISRRLQQTIARDPNPEFRERFFEARYQLSSVRRRYAAATPAASEDGKAQLRSAKAEITILTQVVRDIEEPWWGKFDKLYRDLQADLGEQAKPLERFVAATAPAPVVKPEASGQAKTTPSEVETVVVVPEPRSTGAIILMTVVAVVLAAGAAAGFYVLLSRPQKRLRATYATSASVPAPEFGEVPSDVPDFAALAAAVGTKKRAQSSSTSPPRTPADPSQKPKPRPRPPEDAEGRPPQARPPQPRSTESRPPQPRSTESRPPQPRSPESRPPQPRPPAPSGDGAPRPAPKPPVDPAKQVPRKPRPPEES